MTRILGWLGLVAVVALAVQTVRLERRSTALARTRDMLSSRGYEARKRCLPPDLFMVMLVPPRDHWMNLHAYCLHLWETQDGALIEHMKINATAARAL